MNGAIKFADLILLYYTYVYNRPVPVDSSNRVVIKSRFISN